MEMPKDAQKKEGEVEKPEPERAWEPAGLEAALVRGGTEDGKQDQKAQVASLTLKPGACLRDLEGSAPALTISGSQGVGGKGDPLSPGRQQRGSEAEGAKAACRPHGS